MKHFNSLILTAALITATSAQAQMKAYKAGHVFDISIPEYMVKTTGLNSAATFQFKNSVKDIAGFVIEDSKEDLQVAQITYTSAQEFYDDFIKDFLLEEEQRKISKAESKTIGDTKFIEADASYYDKDVKSVIYYFIGIVETKTTFYKVLCYGGEDSKEKYKADFEKIMLSIKD